MSINLMGVSEYILCWIFSDEKNRKRRKRKKKGRCLAYLVDGKGIIRASLILIKRVAYMLCNRVGIDRLIPADLNGMMGFDIHTVIVEFLAIDRKTGKPR